MCFILLPCLVQSQLENGARSCTILGCKNCMYLASILVYCMENVCFLVCICTLLQETCLNGLASTYIISCKFLEMIAQESVRNMQGHFLCYIFARVNSARSCISLQDISSASWDATPEEMKTLIGSIFARPSGLSQGQQLPFDYL